MLRYGLVLSAALMLTGCGLFQSAGRDIDKTRMAAFAARSEFPSTQPSGDLKLTAIVNRDNSTIKIVNASDQPLRDVAVWINGNFVTQVDSISAHSTQILGRGEFFNNRGRQMSEVNATVSNVVIESQGKVYSVSGPVFERD